MPEQRNVTVENTQRFPQPPLSDEEVTQRLRVRVDDSNAEAAIRNGEVPAPLTGDVVDHLGPLMSSMLVRW